MKKLMVCCLSLLLACATLAAEAEPLIYRVKDEKGGELFLLPSIHYGDEKMKESVISYLIPVIEDMDRLAVELDIASLTGNVVQMLQASRMMLYEGEDSVEAHLSADTLEAAVALLKETGKYSPAYKKIRAACWQSFMEEALLSEIGMTSENGIDMTVLDYAHENQIPVDSMETVIEQYSILLSPSDALSDYFLREMTDNLEAYRALFKELPSLYLSGDEQAMEEKLMPDLSVVPAELQEEAARYYNELLNKRNLHFAERAEKYLASGEKVALMVGAAHIIGEDGIAAALEQKGYALEKVY